MVNKKDYRPFDAFPTPWMQLEFSGTSDSAFALAKVGVRDLKFPEPHAMTPNPPSSPDGSALPPRHRPALGNLAKDTTEQDLWAFDDIDPMEEEATEAPPKFQESAIPVPRDSDKTMARPFPDQPPSKPVDQRQSIRVNVSNSRPRIIPSPTTGQSHPGSEFDDLDHWDEPEATLPAPETPTQSGAVPAMPTPPATAIAQLPISPPADPLDDLSPPMRDNAMPVSLRPQMNLTKVERAGLAALAVLLVIGCTMVFLNTIHRLPTDSGRVKANDFPIRGSQLTIVSAESFWRTPRTADTARRGTQLIPVVDLTTRGGPGAIRVFFRNGDGAVIGDAVTRFLKSDDKFQVAATAGFDDVGMHAAYRTEGNKPWTIEVLQAPTENAAGSEFTKLFEMNISADRR